MKKIVITGASDGIGAEMARQLAQSHGVGVGLILAPCNESMALAALKDEVKPR